MTSATLDPGTEGASLTRENEDQGSILRTWNIPATDSGSGNLGDTLVVTSLDFDLSDATSLLGWSDAVRFSRTRWAKENPF